MSISPPSDIVLDVLRASDPQSRLAATRKLAKTGATFDVDTTRAVIRPTAAQPPRQTFNAEEVRVRLHNQAIRPAGLNAAVPGSAQLTPSQQFETMVMQGFIDKMLPENSAHTFGEGTAGSVWKSYMAEALAKQIAGSGGLGIGDMVVAETSQQAAVSQSATSFEFGVAGGEDKVVSSHASKPASPVFFLSWLQELISNLLPDREHSSSSAGGSTYIKRNYNV